MEIKIERTVNNIIGTKKTTVGERCSKCKRPYIEYSMSGLCPSCKKKKKKRCGIKKDKQSKPFGPPGQSQDKIGGIGNEHLAKWQNNMRNRRII